MFWLQVASTITARGSYRFSSSWHLKMQDGSWKLLSSQAWKHESLKYYMFKCHIDTQGFKDEFTEIIKWCSCKIIAIEEKNQIIRSCCGWSKVQCLLGETQYAVLRVKTVNLFHTSWLMNKYKVISDSSATIKPHWIKLISPASKQTRSEVRNIKKDAQEISRISKFLVSIEK